MDDPRLTGHPVPRVNTDGHLERGMRRRLVDVLRQKGICAADVLDAIGRVPRHRFIDDSAFLRMAYEDVPFPIGHGQTISQPYTVARQTELLRPAHGLKVLEIGSGCGYQTAVLCELGLKVHSIERVRPLHVQTKTRLSAMGYRPHLVYGDGFKGLPSYAPFDRILVTCGAPEVPAQLVAQLKPGGTMVVPVGAGEVQTMLVVEKGADGIVSRSEHGRFRFVPMLESRTEGDGPI